MIGEVRIFAGNFAPRSWAFCEGQLLAISSNTALFSILGTTYGGDGRTTFALPDLRGAVPIGVGNCYVLGMETGSDTLGLTLANMAAHTHEFTPSAVPLPAALPLFATALGGLGFMGWRRRRKAPAA